MNIYIPPSSGSGGSSTSFTQEALSSTTALAASKEYTGTIDTRTFTLPTPTERSEIRILCTAAAQTVITWPANTVRQSGGSGYASTTTFEIGNVEMALTWDGSKWWLADSSASERMETLPISFDPKAVCDGTIDRLFLMNVNSAAYPNGIKCERWYLSFEADPTTEVDLDLKRADAFIGVANAAVMDVLDTTAGASSETTASNINSGAVIVAGKVLYLEFGTAYTEANHQCHFNLTYTVKNG